MTSFKPLVARCLVIWLKDKYKSELLTFLKVFKGDRIIAFPTNRKMICGVYSFISPMVSFRLGATRNTR